MFHLYVASAAADAAFAAALAGALRGAGWQVFDARADLAAGDDAGAVRAKAWSESAWYVVIRSGSDESALRAEALRALQQKQADPMGARVLPVHLAPLDPLDHAFSDLGLLQAIDATDRSAARAAAAIVRVAEARGLRHWGQNRAQVAVIAAMAELGEASGRVATMLRGLRSQVAEAIEADLADASALERTDGSLLRVVLLGGGTAGAEGAERVRALLAEPRRTLVACLDPMPSETMVRFLGELPARVALVESAKAAAAFVPFATSADLPALLRTPAAERLAALLPEPPEGAVVPEAWERWYLDSQARTWEEGRAGALRAWSDRCRLDRAMLYVSLHAAAGRWRRTEDGVEVRAEPRTLERPERDERPIFLDELLSHPGLPHVAVVGEAGTGKTVLMQHVAWSLACHHQGLLLPEACLLDVEGLRGDRSMAPLPVLLEAKSVAAIGRGPVAGVFERLLAEVFGGRAPEGAVQQGLDQGRYLLLVDSLDEVPNVAARDAVLDALKGLCASSRCRVVLTTRPTAHTDVTIPRDFERVDIAPLDEDRRSALVARWRAVENLDAEAWGRLPEALAGLAERYPADGGGQSPLDNPLLLTCVLLVFVEQKRLPDNLADLYERMVRHLCDRRPDDPEAGTPEQKRSSAQRRELLVRVGYALQAHGTTAIPARTLCGRLVAEGRFETTDDAREALDQLAVSTGLLRFETEGRTQVVRPWHRSFQEYLAACQIAGRTGSEADIVAALASEGILTDVGWEGALRFVVGTFGKTGSERARGIVRALVTLADQAPDDARVGRWLGLAAAGVVEYHHEHFEDPPFELDLRARIAERFAARGADWPWRDRLLALAALGRLPEGDPRLPDPQREAAGWVEIGAGRYTIGGDSEALGSLLEQPVEVERFFVRAWPVTVAEYRAFFEATGHARPAWWPQQVHCPNAPVMGMSWHDARAFCRWAQDAWRRPGSEQRPVLAGRFDLPDSAEWEIAARLHRGGPYPWGDAPPGEGDAARASHDWGSSELRAPTPVGMFPLGDAGALLDMAGNVLEWCASILGDGPDTPCHIDDAGGREGDEGGNEALRALRGGSWGLPSEYLRAACRFGSHPGVGDLDCGFRVVFRSPARTSTLDP